MSCRVRAEEEPPPTTTVTVDPASVAVATRENTWVVI